MSQNLNIIWLQKHYGIINPKTRWTKDGNQRSGKTDRAGVPQVQFTKKTVKSYEALLSRVMTPMMLAASRMSFSKAFMTAFLRLSNAAKSLQWAASLP
jgi:hypothetical protein